MIGRREFLKRCVEISILFFGIPHFFKDIANGFVKLSTSKKPNVVFIQGQSCSGCTISATYGNNSDFLEFIINLVRLQLHPTLSFAQGHSFLSILEELIKERNFILVVEGSIPSTLKKACLINDIPFYDYLKKVINASSLVVAAGSCSSWGGIPASNQNVTGALSLPEYMKSESINKQYIRIPGCPAHPDRLMGTLAYFVATKKLPELTDENIPKLYYNEKIHNNCGRYQYFSQDIYLDEFSNKKIGCLLKKGCRGPITYSDCPLRRWNQKVNVCIESNTPCVGCINKEWPFKEDIYLEASNIEDIPWIKLKDLIKND